ncbi:hypothetical protein Tco_0155785, partial [Tanacetum coccineum]
WVFADELEAIEEAPQSLGHAPLSPDYMPGPEHPPSPDYVPGPEEPEQAPLSPDYVHEPEYLEYLVPSNAEAPIEDQSLPDDTWYLLFYTYLLPCMDIKEMDKRKDKTRQNRARDRKEREKTSSTFPAVKGWLDEDLDNYHLKELRCSTQCHTQMSMWIISRGVVLLILLMLGISFKFGITGLLHHVITTIAERIRDNDTSQSKQNLQSSSMTFIHKTLIIPSVLDSCFISSTVCEVKRVPPSPDYIPGPEGPPSPDYVPGSEEPEQAPTSPVYLPYVLEPVYPEYMPPEDDVLLAEEQPLHAAALPTAELPGYIPESNPEEDPEEDPEDDDENEDEEEEEEEGHPALADFVLPVHRMTTRISIRDEPSISLSPREEVERLIALTTPPPSPLTPLSSPLPYQIPSPPLPIPSPLPNSPTHIEIPESCLPLRRGKSILSGPYVPSTVLVQAVAATEGNPAVQQHTTIETVLNMTPENKEHFLTEKEAIFLLLTGIGDEIYSTVDACNTANEMWIAIERLQQGESLNVQDVKTNLFWEFGKFTSRDGESMKSYYNASEFNDIRAERITKSANPLALLVAAQPYSDNYYQAPKPQRTNATSSSTSTRHKGKQIAKLVTPQSESVFEHVP